MMSFHASPIGRMLLPWVAGILWAQYQNAHNPNTYLYLALMSGGLYALALFCFTKLPHRLRPFISAFALIIPFSVGAWHTQSQNEKRHPQHYTHAKTQSIQALVEIIEPAVEKDKTFQLRLRCLAHYDSLGIHNLYGKVWVYIPKETYTVNDFKPGQRLWMKLHLKPIPKNTLPGTFQYADYAARHQVYATAYVRTQQWQWANKKSWPIATAQMTCTQFLKKRLAQGIHDPQALGIAEALLFGDRQDIDKELWQHYSRSGMVHLVAISGMHLGLVYLGLLSLLTRLFGHRKRGIIPALIGLWTFAWITGMPASVMRAAWMFTLLGIGELGGQKQESLNTLFAAALIMLIIEPLQLYDVGFQLSYLAVASLMVFQTPIFLYFMRYCPTWTKPLTQLISGTLAAQILTTPWLLFLFQQIPVWVLLTNIIAVPVSTFIIYAEIVWVFMSPLPYALSAYEQSLTWSIQQLNALAEWVSRQPHAVWESAVWTLPEIVFAYAGIYFWFHFIKQGKPQTLLYALSSIAVLLGFSSIEHNKALQQSGWVLYTTKNKPIVQVYHGTQSHCFDTLIPPNIFRYQYQGFQRAKHLHESTAWPLTQHHRDGFHIYHALQKTVVYLEKPYIGSIPFRVDALILHEKIPLGTWLNSWHCKQQYQVSRYPLENTAALTFPIKHLEPGEALPLFTSP